MPVSRPIPITLPAYGALFAESVHAPDFTMMARRDPYHKVIYVFQGRVAYWADQRDSPIVLEQGSVLFVPRNERHRITDNKPSVLLLLCLTEEFMKSDPDLPQLWGKLRQSPERHVRVGRLACERLQQMWRRGLAEKQEPRAGAAVMVRSLAAQVLAHLVRDQPHAGGTTGERVQAVANEIRETFYDQWNLDRAATRAGLSRRRFSALFHEATQQTFSDFITRCRLARAAQLLQAGDHSVLGAMFSSGFNDVSHFYRLFRRQFGCAPARWALQQRAGNHNPGKNA